MRVGVPKPTTTNPKITIQGGATYGGASGGNDAVSGYVINAGLIKMLTYTLLSVIGRTLNGALMVATLPRLCCLED